MKPSRRFARTTLLCFLFLSLAFDGMWAAHDTIAKLQEKLNRATKPVERARIVAKLAQLQLDDVAAAYGNGRYDEGALLLGKCVDGVEQAHQGLQSMAVNPRRKSKGFKELEISVRESLRRLRDLAGTVSFRDREPIEAAIGRLDKVENDLLNALFDTAKRKKSGQAR